MRITWWGHATTVIEDSGVRVLTDPVLTNRVAHLRRRTGPAPDESACRVDLAVVSHLHLDHLHVPSLRRLTADALLLVPRGGGGLVRGVRCRVREVVVGDSVEVGRVRVEVLPASHDGRRGPWSRAVAPALGFLVSGSGTTYFAGDTDLFDGMAEFGPVDVALLPVGGWGPTLGAGHLDPSRAAQAARVLRAETAIPIHYGTFWPIGLDRWRTALFHDPGRDFAAAAPAETTVRLLRSGETVDVGAAA